MIDVGKEQAAFEAWHIEFCSRYPELMSRHGFGDDRKAKEAWMARAAMGDEDLRKDAERYRWLKTHAADAHMWSDESIDAAMSQGKGAVHD